MDVLTTKELASAIGVSESSIKRWADSGALRSARTAGGHRRISVSDAVTFIRETGAAVVRPELLGLAAGDRDVFDTGADAAELLERMLLEGNSERVRGLMQALYLRGMSVAAIVDGPVRQAMQKAGELWLDSPDGILIEHRATDTCVEALNHLRSLTPSMLDGPLALGGSVPGDPYVIPSLSIAAVLQAEGFQAVNLGANIPLDALLRGVEQLAPAFVWLSVSECADLNRMAREIENFADRVAESGVHVIAGGRALPRHLIGSARNLHVGGSMAELAAYAGGLKAASQVARLGDATAEER